MVKTLIALVWALVLSLVGLWFAFGLVESLDARIDYTEQLHQEWMETK